MQKAFLKRTEKFRKDKELNKRLKKEWERWKKEIRGTDQKFLTLNEFKESRFRFWDRMASSDGAWEIIGKVRDKKTRAKKNKKSDK